MKIFPAFSHIFSRIFPWKFHDIDFLPYKINQADMPYYMPSKIKALMLASVFQLVTTFRNCGVKSVIKILKFNFTFVVLPKFFKVMQMKYFSGLHRVGYVASSCSVPEKVVSV